MIANALRDGAWMGINTCIKKEDVIKVFERNPCVICALAKKNKKPTPEGSGIRTVIGEELSCDYVGEIHPKSVHGNTGGYIFTDSATGMEHVYPVRSKTARVSKVCKEDDRVLRKSSAHYSKNSM